MTWHGAGGSPDSLEIAWERTLTAFLAADALRHRFQNAFGCRLRFAAHIGRPQGLGMRLSS